MSAFSNIPQPMKTSRTGRRVSLGLKLPVVVIGLLFVALVVFSYLSIQLSQQALLNTVKGELEDQTLAKVVSVQADLLIAKTMALDLATIAEIENLEEADLIQIIRGMLKENDRVFGSTIAYEPNAFKPNTPYFAPYFSRRPNDTLVFSDLSTREYDYSRQAWYAVPKANRVPIITPPYFDYGGSEIWVVTWSAPFSDDAGNFKGVATADLAFSQTQESINSVQVGENGYAFMIDSAGIILGIGENGGIYETMSDSMVLAAFSENTKGWIQLISDMRNGKSGFVEATDPRGETMLVAYAPIGLETGWSLALAYPKSELANNTNRLQNTLLGYTIIVTFVISILVLAFTRSITQPLLKLREYAGRISNETLTGAGQEQFDTIQIQTQDELEDLGNAINQMSENLRKSFGTLEENVAARTEALARLANELRTIAEVNRELSSIRDQSTLLNVSASLIRERLGYYHVGIFLVDEKDEYAVLQGASSASAEQMLAQNYKLRIGETGLVGNVTLTGKAYIAQDVDLDTVHFENPFLPETRSEIALPLRSYNVTIGALDIQAKTSGAFSEDDIQTLQVLADQLAAAIENAQLVRRLEETLRELSKTNQEKTRQVWQSTINTQMASAYEYDGLQIRPMPRDINSSLAARLESGRPVITNMNSKNTLLIPLTILGQVIGVVGLEQEDAEKTWSEEQIAIAQAAANRAALTLENARLFEESNRRAAKESSIFAATSRISSTSSMENILKAAAEELDKVLNASEITIQFTDTSSDRK
jgi:GAF domain-containing protein/HAMP domain-containing protein